MLEISHKYGPMIPTAFCVSNLSQNAITGTRDACDITGTRVHPCLSSQICHHQHVPQAAVSEFERQRTRDDFVDTGVDRGDLAGVAHVSPRVDLDQSAAIVRGTFTPTAVLS